MSDTVKKITKVATLGLEEDPLKAATFGTLESGMILPEIPDMPAIPETKVAPLADEAALAAARRRRAGRKGTGRASTILTGTKLGSGAGRRKTGG